MTMQQWLLTGDRATRPRAMPPGAEYHRAFAGERRRILRGLAVLALLVVGFVGLSVLCATLARIVDEEVLGRTEAFTPLRHMAGAVGLALLIPYSMLLQRVFYGLPPGSLHSVAGRFRFAVLGRSLLLFGPVVLAATAISALEGGVTVRWTVVDLVAVVLISLVLTPLAAAGEEYAFRGLAMRVLGGWTRGSRAGLVLGGVVTTVLFSLAHGSLDPIVLGSYLVLFGCMAIVTWRTGGLEVAVVLHGTYNLALLFATALHLDVGGALEGRAQVVGSPMLLVPSSALVLVTAVVWLMTRDSGPARTPA